MKEFGEQPNVPDDKNVPVIEPTLKVDVEEVYPVYKNSLKKLKPDNVEEYLPRSQQEKPNQENQHNTGDFLKREYERMKYMQLATTKEYKDESAKETYRNIIVGKEKELAELKEIIVAELEEKNVRIREKNRRLLCKVFPSWQQSELTVSESDVKMLSNLEKEIRLLKEKLEAI
jgi:hypothetical protein